MQRLTGIMITVRNATSKNMSSRFILRLKTMKPNGPTDSHLSHPVTLFVLFLVCLENSNQLVSPELSLGSDLLILVNQIGKSNSEPTDIDDRDQCENDYRYDDNGTATSASKFPVAGYQTKKTRYICQLEHDRCDNHRPKQSLDTELVGSGRSFGCCVHWISLFFEAVTFSGQRAANPDWIPKCSVR